VLGSAVDYAAAVRGPLVGDALRAVRRVQLESRASLLAGWRRRRAELRAFRADWPCTPPSAPSALASAPASAPHQAEPQRRRFGGASPGRSGSGAAGHEPSPAKPSVAGLDVPGAGLQAMLLLRDNFRFRRTIEHEYLSAIAAARREILIANAYFFPGLRLRRALTDAARRGVQVTLLLQGRVEYRLQHYASQAL
jgi:phosphatidylserine/phosphatidylglycerophosphate/cardiolipin synthase-like enzyme